MTRKIAAASTNRQNVKATGSIALAISPPIVKDDEMSVANANIARCARRVSVQKPVASVLLDWLTRLRSPFGSGKTLARLDVIQRAGVECCQGRSREARGPRP